VLFILVLIHAQFERFHPSIVNSNCNSNSNKYIWTKSMHWEMWRKLDLTLHYFSSNILC